ncbi:MAG: hypothetical protein IJV77_06815 [Clostridia bacterium]|nr:hypothetical protein [Clostridia bacterium]
MELQIKDEQNNINYVYSESLWTGKRGLTVNGIPAMKVSKKVFQLPTEEGPVRYEIKGSIYSDISIIVNGYAVSTDHEWYEKMLIWLPMISIVFGVIWGGLIGALIFGLFATIAMTINMEIMYSSKGSAFKVFVGLLVFVITTGLALLVDLFVVAFLLAAVE